MKFTRRDQRALLILLLVLVVVGGYLLMVVPANPKRKGINQALRAEPLLALLADRRKAAANVSQKQEVLRLLAKQLAVQESSLIQADTAPQAQAQLLQILKNITSQQQPPLDVERIELSSPEPVGDAYGEVSVSITFQCTIDKLLNLIADLTAYPEIIATDEINLIAGDQKLKTLEARLTVKGLVHRTLITKPGSPQT